MVDYFQALFHCSDAMTGAMVKTGVDRVLIDGGICTGEGLLGLVLILLVASSGVCMC